MMDSNDLERERGIATSRRHRHRLARLRINIVDTPATPTSVAKSSAPVDGRFVLLLVDASRPMPQTTFVTRKALARPEAIVVVNKVDRPAACPTG